MVESELPQNAAELATAERIAELGAQGLTYQQIADKLTAEGPPSAGGEAIAQAVFGYIETYYNRGVGTRRWGIRRPPFFEA